jgi:hypothetical protein
MNVRKGSVSICFTDLCNCKLVREPIANFYWSKGMTHDTLTEATGGGTPFSRKASQFASRIFVTFS